MTVSGERRRAWHDDARVAGQLVDSWASSADAVAVRIPRVLAEQAVEAWERPGEAEGEATGLSPEDDSARRVAGTFALVGAALAERGRWDEAEATVDLSPAVMCELVRTSAGADTVDPD